MPDWDEMAATIAESGVGKASHGGALLDRFVIPPFSILDARQGYWQDRKRSWLALGIKSELGRGDDLTYRAETVRDMNFYIKKRAREAELGRPLTTAEQVEFSKEARGAPAPARGHGRAFTQDLGKGETWNEVREKRGREAGDENATDANLLRRPAAKAAPPAGLGLVADAVDTSRRAADERSNLTGASEMPEYADFGMANVAPGTSIFDPVLCEMHYRWFAPPGGSILDPFSGGSVRGMIAAVLGHQYTGVDLAERQVLANRDQAAEILSAGDLPIDAMWVTDPDELTPIESRGVVRVKRDDVFTFGGVRGGKVRTCLKLALDARVGLVTAGSRSSPQVNIVAHVGRALGLPVRAHTPEGALSPEVVAARDAGAEIVQHKAGYNNVIKARAREDAGARGWTEIPFGMECQAAIDATAAQVLNVPDDVERIVVPVGSGMTLAGILHGIAGLGRSTPVLGVVVGADPVPQLDKYGPPGWREICTLVPSGSDYHVPAPDPDWHGIILDPHYEAKTIPFLEPGDLLWVVGVRQTSIPDRLGDGLARKPVPRWIAGDSTNIPTLIDERERFDYVFSCPPYFDLEVYSDDPRDLSAMTYEAFREGYRAIIKAAVDRLRPGRFATFVVSEVRAGNDRGQYVGLVPDTIRAFEDAGAVFYNEGILVNAVGSLPMRVGRQFEATRKLGRMHQNVLTFLKGPIPRGWVHERETAPEPQLALFGDPPAAVAPVEAEPTDPADDPAAAVSVDPGPAPLAFDDEGTLLGELPADVEPAGWFDDPPPVQNPDGVWANPATGEILEPAEPAPVVVPEPEPVVERPVWRPRQSTPSGDNRPAQVTAPPADPLWDPADQDRTCYTCGSRPTGRFGDGSPQYSCGPHPSVVAPPAEAPTAELGL